MSISDLAATLSQLNLLLQKKIRTFADLSMANSYVGLKKSDNLSHKSDGYWQLGIYAASIITTTNSRGN